MYVTPSCAHPQNLPVRLPAPAGKVLFPASPLGIVVTADDKALLFKLPQAKTGANSVPLGAPWLGHCMCGMRVGLQGDMVD